MTDHYSKAMPLTNSKKRLVSKVFAIKVKIRTIRAQAPDLRFGLIN
jgi:helix-turn-helix protein